MRATRERTSCNAHRALQRAKVTGLRSVTCSLASDLARNTSDPTTDPGACDHQCSCVTSSTPSTAAVSRRQRSSTGRNEAGVVCSTKTSYCNVAAQTFWDLTCNNTSAAERNNGMAMYRVKVATIMDCIVSACNSKVVNYGRDNHHDRCSYHAPTVKSHKQGRSNNC
jgi:hypothetical protein